MAGAKKKRERATYTPQQKMEILGEYAKAKNKAAFAEAHGIPQSTIVYWQATQRSALKKVTGIPAHLSDPKQIEKSARAAAEAVMEHSRELMNGHGNGKTSAATVFATYREIERACAKIPKAEAIEVLGYLRGKLSGERAG